MPEIVMDSLVAHVGPHVDIAINSTILLKEMHGSLALGWVVLYSAWGKTRKGEYCAFIRIDGKVMWHRWCGNKQVSERKN